MSNSVGTSTAPANENDPATFNLIGLNIIVNLTTAPLFEQGSIAQGLNFDAEVDFIDISLSDARGLFKFITSSIDFQNSQPEFEAVIDVSKFPLPFISGLEVTAGMINSDGGASDQLVKKDLLRHFGLSIFGSHDTFDFISNPEEMMSEVVTADTTIHDQLTAQLGAAHGLASDDTSSANMVLSMVQVLSSSSGGVDRFLTETADSPATAGDDTPATISFPFRVGDIIQFVCTYTHTDVTNLGTSTIQIADRKYLIKYIVVADS